MTFKAIILCASALLVQCISGNCVNRIIGPSCGCSFGNDYVTISSSGGDFVVTSIGPISPSGIAVASDLSLNGELDLNGILPFLSAVAFEGDFPTSGSAAVSYGCGDGSSIGMTNVIGGSSDSGKIIDCGCRY